MKCDAGQDSFLQYRIGSCAETAQLAQEIHPLVHGCTIQLMRLGHHSTDQTSIGLADASAPGKDQRAVAHHGGLVGQRNHRIQDRVAELLVVRCSNLPCRLDLTFRYLIDIYLFLRRSAVGTDVIDFAFANQVLFDRYWPISGFVRMCVQPSSD